MRLAFRGVDGTANPHFEDDLTGYSVSGEDGPIAEALRCASHRGSR